VEPTLSPELLERARRTLRRRDPILGEVVRRVGPCTLRPRGDPYAALQRAILHQQLAGAAAAAIERRLKALFAGRVPRPAALLAHDAAALRGVGLSRQKLAALQDLARAFHERELTAARLRRLDDDAVVEAVTRVRGVGEWTAHMLLLFSLGRPDVLPVGDYGVRKAAQVLYGLDGLPGKRELESIAEPWRPWRSVAVWYLWRHAQG
jgi:DNA-3-methyladenine glycosylase II